MSKVIEITKIIEWDMGHRVPHHRNKCQNPHGHRYRLEVSVTGELNQTQGASDEGMVWDFADLKEVMRRYIHDPLDHCFMVYEKDPVMATFAKEHKEMHFVLVPFIPTAENLVSWCFEALSPHLPSHVRLSRLRLYETPNSWADYLA